MGSTAFNKYPPNSTFGGAKVLNIGCGYAQYVASNVTNLDGEACSGANVIWDLGNPGPLPFENETFDFILANHTLEHVPNWWHCFEECARVLKVGGRMEVWGPGMGSDSVLGYRDHINTINQCSWWGTYQFFRNANNAWASANAAGPASQMSMYDMKVIAENHKWLRWLPRSVKAWCVAHLRNVMKEVGFFFIKVGPENVAITDFDFASVEALL